MSILRPALFAFALATSTAPGVAAPGVAVQQPLIPEALQQEAMTCIGEAAQICPEVFTAEDHGVACMVGKRQAFSPRCRVIYDKVAKVLARNGLVTAAAGRRP